MNNQQQAAIAAPIRAGSVLTLVLGKKIAITSVQLLLLAFLLTLVIDSKKKIIWSYQAYVFGNIAGSSIIMSNYMQGIQSPYYNRYGL